MGDGRRSVLGSAGTHRPKMGPSRHLAYRQAKQRNIPLDSLETRALAPEDLTRC
jgi:hypothetical protein